MTNLQFFGGGRAGKSTYELYAEERERLGLPVLPVDEWVAERATPEQVREVLDRVAGIEAAAQDILGARDEVMPAAEQVAQDRAVVVPAAEQVATDRGVVVAAAQQVATDRGVVEAAASQVATNTALAAGYRTQAQTSAAMAQASSRTVATWEALAELTGSVAGEGAEVLDSDTGTHTDPVVGGTVPNAGRYSWSAAQSGWRRIGVTALGDVLRRGPVAAETNILTLLGNGNYYMSANGGYIGVPSGFDQTKAHILTVRDPGDGAQAPGRWKLMQLTALRLTSGSLKKWERRSDGNNPTSVDGDGAWGEVSPAPSPSNFALAAPNRFLITSAGVIDRAPEWATADLVRRQLGIQGARLADGTDVALVTTPGVYALSSAFSYLNLPAEAVGVTCELRVTNPGDNSTGLGGNRFPMQELIRYTPVARGEGFVRAWWIRFADTNTPEKMDGPQAWTRQDYVPGSGAALFLEGASLATFGDSITMGTALGSTQPHIAAITGADIINCGIGGSTMGAHTGWSTSVWFNDLGMDKIAAAILTNDFSGLMAAAEGYRDSAGGADRTGQVANIAGIDYPSLRFATVAYGTNDFANHRPLGAADSLDRTTFNGALNLVLRDLQLALPHTRIMFQTPIWRGRDGGDAATNDLGLHLVDYVEAIKARCAEYGVPVADMYGTAGFNEYTQDTLLAPDPDLVHPSTAGYGRLGACIGAAMRTHFALSGV